MSRLAVAGVVGTVFCALLAGVGISNASARTPSAPQTLYVGSFDGITTPAASTFPTIQDAVNAAKKGAWILIAPGDYHETGDTGANAPSTTEIQEGWYGGVDITTSGIHLRGMDRNSVIVDGTSTTAPTACSSSAGDQNSLGGLGRNGIVVWKAKGVSVENLTVCNFIGGSGNSGNEIWWNGGAGSGKVGLRGYSGSYLTATSTYFAASDPSDLNVCSTCALYGIFSSDAKNGAWDHIYANNFADSGMYVGACQRACSVTIDDAWMENNALGYSGTNSGGQIVIENSTFDNNKEGVDTNTALTGDPPPPQNGACPGNKASATSVLIPGSINSCWVFTHNLLEANNNANVPVSGTAGLGPTGTGMTVSGGRYDTITGNRFLDNGAWGMLFVPYPDSNTSSDGKSCKPTGGLDVSSYGIAGVSCLYDPEGNYSLNNEFSGNGSFGNPSNADFGNLLAGGHEPENCFSGNTEWDSLFTTQTGPATDADSADGLPQLTSSTCGARTPKSNPTLAGPNTDSVMLVQVECDAGVLSGASCSSAHYPQATAVTMQPLPSLPSMPNPCVDAPANLWCPDGSPA